MGDLAEHACAVTWWAEKIPESCIVWGWKIFQWGRLAKVLSFVGGLVIPRVSPISCSENRG